jgi:RNA polymerase sigma factor (sigma-70 family)
MQNKTDAELMRFIMEKHRPALEEMYDRYVKLVYSFAMKSTKEEQSARDIVQMVFTRLWTTEKGYDSNKGQFVSWLLTITRNITIDYLRKEKRHEAIMMDQEHWDQIPSHLDNDPAEIVSRKLVRQHIQKAYQWLSENQVQLLQHLYFEGYSLSEIAQMKNEPLGTVKSRLHQTLKILRHHLLEGGGINDGKQRR